MSQCPNSTCLVFFYVVFSGAILGCALPSLISVDNFEREDVEGRGFVFDFAFLASRRYASPLPSPMERECSR